MHKHTTMTTGRASLCALGEYLRRHCFFAPLRESVQIRQKTVRYRPIDKLLDALSGILCGAKAKAQNNVTIRTDRDEQRAFGRSDCAEQSTIARTLRACTAENVVQLEKVSWYYLKRYGVTPHHRFHDTCLWVDIDLTPMPIGAKAEGSERTWMGRNRSKTGRKTLRITASPYREILHETLLRGTATDRKSTRLNSSHSQISYAVFCLKNTTSPASQTSSTTIAGRPPPRPPNGLAHPPIVPTTGSSSARARAGHAADLTAAPRS